MSGSVGNGLKQTTLPGGGVLKRLARRSLDQSTASFPDESQSDRLSWCTCSLMRRGGFSTIHICKVFNVRRDYPYCTRVRAKKAL